MIATSPLECSRRRLPRPGAARRADDRGRPRRRRTAVRDRGRGAPAPRGIRVALFIDPDAARSSFRRGRGAGRRAAHRRATPTPRAPERGPQSSRASPRPAAARPLAGLDGERRPRPDYHNVGPVAAMPEHRRAQHRPRDRRPRRLRRTRPRVARDEARPDRSARRDARMIDGIGMDVAGRAHRATYRRFGEYFVDGW